VTVVLDSSATLAWAFGDERTPAIEILFDDVVADGALVPTLWHLEVANSLSVAVRRGRITIQVRDEVLADLACLDIVVDAETDLHAWSATLKIADLYRLPLYDAAYLELAQRRRLPLATLDTALREAATRSGVPVVP